MLDPETVSLPSPLHTGSALAELLEHDPAWPDGAIEEVLRIGSAAAGAIVVALIEARRRDRVEDRVLFRACRLAGVLRVRAALPLLVDLALDWRSSDAAAKVAMRAAKPFGEHAHDLVRRRCEAIRLEASQDVVRRPGTVPDVEERRIARQIHRMLQLLLFIRPLSELDDGDEERRPFRRAAAPERNARCPCGSGRKYRRCHGAARAPAREAPAGGSAG